MQSASAIGCSRIAFTRARNSAAGAPLRMRWSQAIVRFMPLRTTSSPSRTTGLGSILPTARIADCGGLMTAVNVVTPYMPRFVIENVAPDSSGGLILPSRTFSASARDSLAICPRPLRSASKIGRDDQRALARDRDADVHAAVHLEAAVLVARVHEREVAQGDRARLDDHVVVGGHRRVLLLGERLELVAQLDRALHVDVHRQREVRDRRLRLGHAAGDDLLDPRGLLDGDLALAGLAGGRLVALGRLLLSFSSAAGCSSASASAGSASRACGSSCSAPSFSAFAPAPDAAASTSALTIRPPGPVPSISTGRCRARGRSAARPARPSAGRRCPRRRGRTRPRAPPARCRPSPRAPRAARPRAPRPPRLRAPPPAPRRRRPRPRPPPRRPPRKSSWRCRRRRTSRRRRRRSPPCRTPPARHPPTTSRRPRRRAR